MRGKLVARAQQELALLHSLLQALIQLEGMTKFSQVEGITTYVCIWYIRDANSAWWVCLSVCLVAMTWTPV